MPGFRRTSFGLGRMVQPEINAVYASQLVQHARMRGHRLDFGTLALHLPQSFGFCHGVARALQLAYELRRCFPEVRLFITDEIVHNPLVNRRLLELGYRFLHGRYADGATLADVGAGDVVLLPAFGAEADEVARIEASGAFIVDATCGEVMSVWKQVMQFARDGYTTVIHGTHGHQETRATASRVIHRDPLSSRPPQAMGHYVVVANRVEAERVCAFIESGQGADELRASLAGKSSPAFDPLRDLERIGIANQTTMLARETLAIQARFRAAVVHRYGATEVGLRFRASDTICSATQDRQDAMVELLDCRPDLLIVVGGYNSANTGHLAELGEARGVPTYHVDDAACIVGRHGIRHWDAQHQRPMTRSGWWPERVPLHVALAAGASTPDSILGSVMLRLLEVAGVAGDLDPLRYANSTLPPPVAIVRAALGAGQAG